MFFKKLSRHYLPIVLLLALIFGFYAFEKNQKKIKKELLEEEPLAEKVSTEKPKKLTEEAVISPKAVPSTSPPVKVATEKLPDKIKIDVPFVSQAPFGIWDEYHEEACEEAALLMLVHFLNKDILDKDSAEKELQALIAFQIKNYGDYKDSNVAQTIRLAEDFYGLKNLKAVYDFSLEEMKKYLAQGQPVIVPTAGRLLKNPNFTSPGPWYHNLVLVGFEKGAIITNDPGTRKGEGYRYEEKLLYSAIHDFTGDKEKIETGRKAMIVVD